MKIVKDGRIIEPGEACRKLNPHLFADKPKSEACPGCGVSAGELCEDWCRAISPTDNISVVKRRIRQDSKPLLNNLEKEFKAYYEDLTGYELTPQSVRFRLANGCWYKPDFIFFCTWGVISAYEVKGPHVFRGGFENLKIAASLYKDVNWVLAWKEGNDWKMQDVLP